jgi:hypothetical protein
MSITKNKKKVDVKKNIRKIATKSISKKSIASHLVRGKDKSISTHKINTDIQKKTNPRKKQDASLTNLLPQNIDLKAAPLNAQELEEKVKSEIAEHKEENDLLLIQLHLVQEELERYFLENQQLKKKVTNSTQNSSLSENKVYFGVAQRVKDELSYKLGNVLITNSKSLMGILAIPGLLIKVAKKHNQQQLNIPQKKLPPISSYADADQAEIIKGHLSYRFGAVLISSYRSPIGWIKMPFKLFLAYRQFKQNRQNKHEQSNQKQLPVEMHGTILIRPVSLWEKLFCKKILYELSAMQATHVQLEKDKTELLKKQEATLTSLTRRETELSAMQATHVQLEKDKTELLKKQEATLTSLTRRETELSAMQATHVQLEKDKDTTADINNLLQEVQEKLIIQQKKLSENALLQIESFLRLQNYVADDIVLPDMHGWRISPDLGMQIVQMIETGNYDAVVEFGSGTSTLLMALALKKQAKKRIAMPVKFIAFEHLTPFFEETKKLLSVSGLNANVTLIHAKLVSIKGLNQTNFDYYDCLEALSQFKKELKIPNPKVIVIVDGPPGRVGPHARYPAMQFIEQAFEGLAHVDYIMDDYMRKEEREIVSMWERHFNDQGREIEKKEYLTLEKQACVLSVKPLQKVSKII